jgi:hypothetical protein
MRKTLILCLPILTIVSLSSAAPPGGDGRRGGRAAGVFAEGIELSSTDAGLEEGRPANRFDFSATRDLWVRVKLAGMRRTARLTLSFVDPSGRVFFEDYLTFSSEGEGGTSVGVDRRGRPSVPTTVFAARKLPGGFALDHAVPIDGTNFTRFPQAGAWKVRARIEEPRRTFTVPLEVTFGAAE